MTKTFSPQDFYIASSLENATEVQQLRDLLIAQGHRVTYDWTTHGSVQHDGLPACRRVALKETRGVMDAEVVIVILPGGSGTHIEMGMAIMSWEYAGDDVKIILVAPRERYHGTPERGTCAFYHHPAVTWVEKTDDWQEWMEKVVNLVNGDTEEEEVV